MPRIGSMDVVALEMNSAGGSGPDAKPQRGRVSLGRLARQLDWGSFVAAASVCIALLIWQAILEGPRERPFLVTDATIAFPYMGSSVPYWLAVVVSTLAMAGSVLLAELWLARHADATDAAAAVVHFWLDAICAFFVCGLTTEVTKEMVGRLRPNFLSLCQPAGEGNAATVQFGQPASANAACTAADSKELTDAHYSFPSGHTSSVFVLATWAAVYCIWALSMRPSVRRSAAQLARMTLGGRLAHEAGAAAAWLWVLLQLGWAWAVGVSRITDFKHHPSDVIAGAFLGTLLGGLFAGRAISRLDRVVLGAGGGADDGTPGAAASLLRAAPGSNGSSIA